MTIIVHHLNHSRSQRIVWLLEELSIPYQIKTYKRLDDPDMSAPPELFEVHPLGKSPVIEDDGRVIAESSVIIDYLIKKHGQGRGVARGEGNEFDDFYWNQFAEASLMPQIVMKIHNGEDAPQVARRYLDPDVAKKLDYVADYVSKRNHDGRGMFVGGDKDGAPTSADYQMCFALEAIVFGKLFENVPEVLVNYVKYIHARPAYQNSLKKPGMEYMFAEE